MLGEGDGSGAVVSIGNSSSCVMLFLLHCELLGSSQIRLNAIETQMEPTVEYIIECLSAIMVAITVDGRYNGDIISCGPNRQIHIQE